MCLKTENAEHFDYPSAKTINSCCRYTFKLGLLKLSEQFAKVEKI